MLDPSSIVLYKAKNAPLFYGEGCLSKFMLSYQLVTSNNRIKSVADLEAFLYDNWVFDLIELVK